MKKIKISIPVTMAISHALELKQWLSEYLLEKPNMEKVEIELDVSTVKSLMEYAKQASQATGLDVAYEDIAACILTQAITKLMQEDKETLKQVVDDMLQKKPVKKNAEA